MTELVTVNVSELSGAALDWAVAQTGSVTANDNGLRFGVDHRPTVGGALLIPYKPSTNWSQGGPLMDRHCKGFGMVQDRTHTRWRSFAYQEATGFQRMLGGETILIAFCRALVALTLGETVQVPAQIETDHV